VKLLLILFSLALGIIAVAETVHAMNAAAAVMANAVAGAGH
jgi:hypothetical protein